MAKPGSICLLFTLHASHQTTNYPKTKKSVLYTKQHKTKDTNIKHKMFEKLVPSVLLLLKKALKARTCWYHGPFY